MQWYGYVPPIQSILIVENVADPMQNAVQNPLCIPYTRLLVTMRWGRIASSTASPLSVVAASIHPLLSTAHPRPIRHRPSTPSLLHRRRFGLPASRTTRLPTTPDDAAEDGEEQEATDPTADTDDEVLIMLDQTADFFGRVRAFTLALWDINNG